MLEDVLKSYRKKAEEINWKQYNQNELFFNYIQYENDPYLSDAFYAAIICRYFGYSGRIYLQCNRHIPFEECYDCILDSIKYVLEKRVWENPNSSLYKDPKGPDKAMHIAMKRQKGIMLAKYTAHRRLSNFNTLSIDASHESYGDSADGLLFGSNTENDHLTTFISCYLNYTDERWLEGIFLDAICFSSPKINTQALVKYIKSLTFEDAIYISKEYNIPLKRVKKMIYDINNMSPMYIKLKLNNFLERLKREGGFNDKR